jgi:hypothetical protein
MERPGVVFRDISDPEALAWEDHRQWQSLSIGERLQISFELSEMAYMGRETEPFNGLERLPRPVDSLQQA